MINQRKVNNSESKSEPKGIKESEASTQKSQKSTSNSILSNVYQALSIFIRFCRPHTLIHTTLAPLCIAASTCGGYSALANKPIHFFLSLFALQTACQAANIWIVGLNQVTDVPYDVINKPELPMASGELSKSAAFKLLFSVFGLGVILLFASGCSWLIVYMWLSLIVIGSLYSIPPFRFKDNPFLASLAITFCRGSLGPFMLYIQTVDLLENNFESPAQERSLFYYINSAPNHAILFTLFFGTCWAFVISVFKDLPDILGDRVNGGRTLAIIFGARLVFWFCVILMISVYVFPPTYLLFSQASLTSLSPLLFWHGLCVSFILFGAFAVNTDNQKDLVNFYQVRIWLVFYAQAILTPLFFTNSVSVLF